MSGMFLGHSVVRQYGCRLSLALHGPYDLTRLTDAIFWPQHEQRGFKKLAPQSRERKGRGLKRSFHPTQRTQSRNATDVTQGSQLTQRPILS